jgi:chromate transporter
MPAVLIVTTLAWAYVRYGTRPEAAGLLYGVKPVVIAVVIQALVRLGRTALKTRGLIALALLGAALNLLGADELLILFGAGLLVILARTAGKQHHDASAPFVALVPKLAAPAGLATASLFGLWPLFWFFLKVGSVLFGSGYVLLAFLRADLVEHRHWLSEARLLDAIAIGQVTPGPVFTTATFIGYLLGGLSGAIVATAGIFLPAFVFVAASGPLLPRLSRSASVRAFLDGVNAASLALMAVVTLQLTRASIVDAPTAMLALVSAALLIRYRLNSTWLILAGGILGMLATALGLH